MHHAPSHDSAQLDTTDAASMIAAPPGTCASACTLTCMACMACACFVVCFPTQAGRPCFHTHESHLHIKRMRVVDHSLRRPNHVAGSTHKCHTTHTHTHTRTHAHTHTYTRTCTRTRTVTLHGSTELCRAT